MHSVRLTVHIPMPFDQTNIRLLISFVSVHRTDCVKCISNNVAVTNFVASWRKINTSFSISNSRLSSTQFSFIYYLVSYVTGNFFLHQIKHFPFLRLHKCKNFDHDNCMVSLPFEFVKSNFHTYAAINILWSFRVARILTVCGPWAA